MARSAQTGRSINLRVRFYRDGVLFDPISISDVEILKGSPDGSVVTTITPTQTSTGVYTAVWTSTVPGTYYDKWTWQARSDLGNKVQIYPFIITPGLVDERPARVGGRLFVGQSEVDFFNGITKELIQKVVGQKIIYYAISEEHTNTHRLYDEAIKKTSWRPVEINALILFNEPLQTVTQFSIDTIYSIEVYFHIHELRERKVIPREGDFVKFGDILYEIEKLNKPQIVYGQIENQVMTKAICRVSRKSQFEVLDSIQGR
jgi:hypothetical protein